MAPLLHNYPSSRKIATNSTGAPCDQFGRNMSFQLPSNTLSQADLDASNKSPVYVAVAVGFLLATAGVILRAAARRKSQATFAWDDYTIIFALVSSPAPPSPTAVYTADALRLALDPSLCVRHLLPPLGGKVWTGSTSSRCHFHRGSISKSRHLPCRGRHTSRLLTKTRWHS